MQGLDDIQLRDILIRAIGSDRAGVALEAFHQPASVSVRINPSKVDEPEAFAVEHFGHDVQRIPWSPYGFMLGERPKFTLDPLFHCGCYYVQDSSAMVIGSIFRDMLPKPGIVSDRPESWICAPRQVEKVPIWLHRFAKRSGMTSCLSRMRSCVQGCLSWLTTLRCGAIRTWLSQAWILRRSQGWRAFSTSLSQMFLALAKECSARMPRLSRIGRKM